MEKVLHFNGGKHMDAFEVYKGSDGALTKRYYALLALSGPIGDIAMNLFRAQKCSARAKKYRGGIAGKGSFRSMAYEKKGWSIEQLCKALVAHSELGFNFGWKLDPKEPGPANQVLYVDLPEGQVSFHSLKRYVGPDYAREWDGVRGVSDARILRFCNRIVKERLEGPQKASLPESQIGMFQ